MKRVLQKVKNVEKREKLKEQILCMGPDKKLPTRLGLSHPSDEVQRQSPESKSSPSTSSGLLQNPGPSKQKDDSDPQETFEDAVECIKSLSDSTSSDDTDKLTKDFEVLQLSSQDESEKSSQSWQKCEADELQESTCSKEPEPKAGPSRIVEQLQVESKPTKTSLLAQQEAMLTLKKLLSNLKKQYVFPDNEEACVSNSEASYSPSLDPDEEYKHMGNLQGSDVIDMINNMMGTKVVYKKPLSEVKKRIYRAFSVAIYIKTLSDEKHSSEVIEWLMPLLDDNTRTLWHRELCNNENLDINDVIKFLFWRCQIADNHKYLHKGERRSECYVCKMDHRMVKCDVFRDSTVDTRWQMTKENRLCENCLRGRHPVWNCLSNFSCRVCDDRHNTFLHSRAVQKKQKGRRQPPNWLMPDPIGMIPPQVLRNNPNMKTYFNPWYPVPNPFSYEPTYSSRFSHLDLLLADLFPGVRPLPF